MKKLILSSQRTSSGTIHHLRVEGVKDISDLRKIYSELRGAHERKFTITQNSTKGL
jgi:hypothetical protein